MNRTVKACITVLLLLLIAAVVVAVLYSQGVFDSLIPEENPGTDEPGTDTPGGNTDEPGTDTPGTDEPGTEKPDLETVIVYNDSAKKINSIYQLAPNTQYVFSLTAVNEAGEEVSGVEFTVPDNAVSDSSNYYGVIKTGTYIVHRDPSSWEFISDEWLDITQTKFMPGRNANSITIKSASVSGNNLVIQTGVALEERCDSFLPSYHGTLTYNGMYSETVETCYVSIPVYYEGGFGTVKVITTNTVTGEDQVIPDPEDPPVESDPAIPELYHTLYFSDEDITEEDISSLMVGAEEDGTCQRAWIIKGGMLEYPDIPTGIFMEYYPEEQLYLLGVQTNGETEYVWASKDNDLIYAGWNTDNLAVTNHTVTWKSANADVVLKYISFNSLGA